MPTIKPHQIQQYANQERRISDHVNESMIVYISMGCKNNGLTTIGTFYSERFKK